MPTLSRLPAVRGGPRPGEGGRGARQARAHMQFISIYITEGLACAHRIGCRPFVEGLDLEKVGIELDKRGRVAVDEHFENMDKNAQPLT